jgi:hypothetical protein
VDLFEHKDFEQAILGAEKHFSGRRLCPAVIEKDYYVTEALRVIAATAPDKIKAAVAAPKVGLTNPINPPAKAPPPAPIKMSCQFPPCATAPTPP